MKKVLFSITLFSFLMTGCVTPNETMPNTMEKMAPSASAHTVFEDEKGPLYYVGEGVGAAFAITLFVVREVVSRGGR